MTSILETQPQPSAIIDRLEHYAKEEGGKHGLSPFVWAAISIMSSSCNGPFDIEILQSREGFMASFEDHDFDVFHQLVGALIKTDQDSFCKLVRDSQTESTSLEVKMAVALWTFSVAFAELFNQLGDV